jgi:hypothetical protein
LGPGIARVWGLAIAVKKKSPSFQDLDPGLGRFLQHLIFETFKVWLTYRLRANEIVRGSPTHLDFAPYVVGPVVIELNGIVCHELLLPNVPLLDRDRKTDAPNKLLFSIPDPLFCYSVRGS